MAFWGASVVPYQPYTLKLDGDHKRVRISQATLGEYTAEYWTKARSTLRCVVGSKTPVYLCSLWKESPFFNLDLEFEESEEVVFSIKGPQGIHLSGYYVTPRGVAKRETSTSPDDNTINCCLQEDITMAETEEERKLTANDQDIGDSDRFMDDTQDNIRENDYDLRDGFINDNDMLVNDNMHDHAHEKIAEEQAEIICAFDNSTQREDEDYVLCIRKIETTTTNMMEKQGEDTDEVTVEPDDVLKDAGSVDSTSSETADALNRSSEQEREASLPSFPSDDVDLGRDTEPEKISKEVFSKENNSESNTLSYGIALALHCMKHDNKSLQGGERKNVEAETDHQKNALEEDKEQQAKTESNDDLCQDCARDQHGEKLFTNVEIGGCHPLLPPAEISGDVGQRSRERLKDGDVKVLPTTTNDGEQTKDQYSSGIKFVSGQISCANNSIPPAEVSYENGQKSKKRKKYQVLEQKCVKSNGTNSSDAPKDEKCDHIVADAWDMVNSVLAEIGENEPASDNEIGSPYHSLLPPAEVSYENVLDSQKRRKIGDLNPTPGEGNCENMVIVLLKKTKELKPIDYVNDDIVADRWQSKEESKQKKKQKSKAKENEDNVCAISSKMRTLSNGVIIEDLVTGESEGKIAAPGRKIKVFYTARLRETGTLVESNVGETPIKFRLGDKRIIKGWNSGIEGMHIWGRRRLIIPPPIGYGKRAVDVIPPNSWIVYDIELVSVR